MHIAFAMLPQPFLDPVQGRHKMAAACAAVALNRIISTYRLLLAMGLIFTRIWQLRDAV
jgi:hypothetical protein